MQFQQYLKRQFIIINGFDEYSQSRIAKELGLGQSTIACYLNGHRSASPENLTSIISYFSQKQMERAIDIEETQEDVIAQCDLLFKAFHLMQCFYGCESANQFWECIEPAISSLGKQ